MKPLISRASMVHLHRHFALVVMVFILFVAITGLLLQHSKDLGWHKKTINNDWLFNIYQVKKAKATAFNIVNKSTFQAIQLGYQWYINKQQLPNIEGNLVGGVYLEPLIVLASDNKLHLFNEYLELVESIEFQSITSTINHIGLQNNQLILKTSNKTYRIDENLLEIKPTKVTSNITFSSIEPLFSNTAKQLPEKVSDISYLKFMQDLHSGRLWGLPQWIIPDLTALGLIFLSLSGLMMKWQRRPRK